MTADLLDRVLARTVPTGDCLVWQGPLNNDGYSRVWDGERRIGGHRLVYRLSVGPIPSGMTVDHICFVRACIRPEHLRLLSHVDNARRQREALKTHCVNGHEFTPENTHLRSRGTGRACRKCACAAAARYQARKKKVA